MSQDVYVLVPPPHKRDDHLDVAILCEEGLAWLEPWHAPQFQRSSPFTTIRERRRGNEPRHASKSCSSSCSLTKQVERQLVC